MVYPPRPPPPRYPPVQQQYAINGHQNEPPIADFEAAPHDFSSNISEAYSNNAMDPLACLKQTNTCLNQQHYLDDKYHGVGSTVAKAIHENTGQDKERTSKLIALVTGVSLITLLGIGVLTISQVHKSGNKHGGSDVHIFRGAHFNFDASGTKKAVNTPVYYKEDEFKLYPQNEVVTLMSDPVKNAPDFDTRNGDGAAATVIARVEKGQMDPKRFTKEFKHVDVEVLFIDPSDKKGRATFDEKYGAGAAAMLLRATKVVPNYRGLVMEARKAKIVEFGKARQVAMQKARRTGDNTILLEIKRQTQQLRDKLIAMQKEDMQTEEADAKKEDEEEVPQVPEPAAVSDEESTGGETAEAETPSEVPEDGEGEDAEVPTPTTAR